MTRRIIVIIVFATIWLVASVVGIIAKKFSAKKTGGESLDETEKNDFVVNQEQENDIEDNDNEEEIYVECPYCESLNLKSDMKCSRCGAPLRKKRRKNHK